jgi:hypothetical protein
MCTRCRKGGKECVFKQHSRGRKPAQVKLQSLERSVGKLLNALNDLTDHKYSNERAQVQEALASVKEKGSHDGGLLGRKRVGNGVVSNKEVSKKAKGNVMSTDMASIVSDDGCEHEGNEVTDGDLETDVPAEALGQPALSNPLKLLAHASDVALAGSTDNFAAIGSETGNKSVEEWDDGSIGAATSAMDSSQVPLKQSGILKTRLGASQRGYWDMGIYSTRPDRGAHMDPTTAGVISLDMAHVLFEYFMRNLSAPITLLDPVLHTFDYVQSHSAFLLTTACALAARFTADVDDAEKVANSLDAHIQDVLLPAVLLRGYRSVEIAQAFIVLAAYHSNTRSLDGDRSWSLVGYGIRIAAELDMNARIMSRLTPDTGSDPSSENSASSVSPRPSSDELTQRRLRNRERTWCNLWLYDFSLSTHMGRRSTLGQDPVILGVSAGWQHAPYAIPGDEAIVALIGLRRIQLKNTEFFDHTILANSFAQEPQRRSAALAVQLEFFNKCCASDIDSWKAMYVTGRRKEHNFRTDNLCLYASYARLMLNSYALKCTKDADLLAPFYKDSYCAVMTYLTLYVERTQRHGLTHVHNSSVVTVAYVAVFALKLCSLDRQRFPYIDVDSVFDHVRRLVQELRRAGNVTAWRNGAASSYAPYLAAILSRVERSTQAKDKHEKRTSARRSSATTIPARTAVHSPHTSASTRNSTVQCDAQANPSVQSPSHVVPTTSSSLPFNDVGAVPTSRFTSDYPGFQEATTFFAGPSGVEAYTTDNISFSDESFHFGPHDLQQLESLGFNEASLLAI